ncbi:uncharacterized protein LOC135122861 isoform X1 [Zophobas morio]|uniref:uncharacterized protein LOC135122861 isoform X1 n=1 Tax=Zophobas morio TaxID=2755281 RepID=UPI0030834EB0
MLFLVRLPQWLLVPQWYSWSWQWPCKMQPFRFSRRASGKRARSCQSVTRRPPMPPRCSAPVPVRARMTDSLSHQVRKGARAQDHPTPMPQTITKLAVIRSRADDDAFTVKDRRNSSTGLEKNAYQKVPIAKEERQRRQDVAFVS